MPLVIVTGRAEIVAAGPKALGVADIVAKPFDMTDLLRRVRRAVETTQIVPGGLSWN